MGAAADTLPKTAPTTPAAGPLTCTRSPPRISTDLEGPTAVGTAGAHPRIPKESPIESPPSPEKKLPIGPIPKAVKEKYGAHILERDFADFETARKDVLHPLLASVDPGDRALRIQEPLRSVQQLYRGDYLRGNVEEDEYLMDSIWW